MKPIITMVAFGGLTGLILADAEQNIVSYPVEGRIVAVRPEKDPRKRPNPLIRWVVELRIDEKSRKKFNLDDEVFRIYVHSLSRSFLKTEKELNGALVAIDFFEKPANPYFGEFKFKGGSSGHQSE